jgi:hypothetical protein
MSDTMISMDFVKVDILNVDQLEPSDYIMIDGEIVQVINIVGMKNGYAISYSNDFGEVDLVEVDDYAQFDLYVILE